MRWGMLLVIWSVSLNVLGSTTFPRTIRKMVGPEHSEVFNVHAREWPTVLSNLAKMPLYLLHLSEAGIFVGLKGLSQTPLSFGVWYTSESCSSSAFVEILCMVKLVETPNLTPPKSNYLALCSSFFLYFLPWHHHPFSQTQLYFPHLFIYVKKVSQHLELKKKKKSNITDAKSCLIIAVITFHPLTQELIWDRKAILNSLNVHFPLCLLVINQHFKVLFWSILDKETFQKLTQLRRNF